MTRVWPRAPSITSLPRPGIILEDEFAEHGLVPCRGLSARRSRRPCRPTSTRRSSCGQMPLEKAAVAATTAAGKVAAAWEQCCSSCGCKMAQQQLLL